MNTHADKAQENKNQATANEPVKKPRGNEFAAPFVDARSETIAQRKLQILANNHTARQPQPIQKQSSEGTIQRQAINGIDVYVDGGGYPVWTQADIKWHMTMKDSNRWHITKSDRSMSYWFTCDAGTVTSTNPKKAEYGGHKEKHASLDKAPPTVKQFVETYISTIIKVTDKEP